MFDPEDGRRPDGDELSGLAGLGARTPWLAWPMTIGMLALAGIPGTVGFIGKFQLIHAMVAGAYTWLAIVLVIGSMISLGYYLRVIATMWMRGPIRAPVPAGPASAPSPAAGGWFPPIAGGSAEADVGGAPEASGLPETATLRPEIAIVALGFAAAAIFFGIFPSPLFDFAAHAGHAIAGLF